MIPNREATWSTIWSSPRRASPTRIRMRGPWVLTSARTTSNTTRSSANSRLPLKATIGSSSGDGGIGHSLVELAQARRTGAVRERPCRVHRVAPRHHPAQRDVARDPDRAVVLDVVEQAPRGAVPAPAGGNHEPA